MHAAGAAPWLGAGLADGPSTPRARQARREGRAPPLVSKRFCARAGARAVQPEPAPTCRGGARLCPGEEPGRTSCLQHGRLWPGCNLVAKPPARTGLSAETTARRARERAATIPQRRAALPAMKQPTSQIVQKYDSCENRMNDAQSTKVDYKTVPFL